MSNSSSLQVLIEYVCIAPPVHVANAHCMPHRLAWHDTVTYEICQYLVLIGFAHGHHVRRHVVLLEELSHSHQVLGLNKIKTKNRGGKQERHVYIIH